MMLPECKEPRLTDQSLGPSNPDKSASRWSTKRQVKRNYAAHTGVDTHQWRVWLAALAAVVLIGCGTARKPIRNHVKVQSGFWRTCDEAIDVHTVGKDGFKHFVCTDVNGLQWEVNVRVKP